MAHHTQPQNYKAADLGGGVGSAFRKLRRRTGGFPGFGRGAGSRGSGEPVLQEAPKTAPVFYSLGNHERKCAYREEWMRLVRQSDVVLLDDRDILFEGIRIGGLSSQMYGEANRDFLRSFEKRPEFKLLMCHHPEMWRDYVQGLQIDFTVCGHAHGGQIQIRGQGIYAPGQGFFPKLTHGLHGNGSMILSRGMTNGARFPRINNPCELIMLRLEPERKEI